MFDISDERACDKTWFTPLYRDLNDGGTSEFLHFLQNLKLGDWHPREVLKTAEATEQQRMSADSVSQWSQFCIDTDAITARGSYGSETTHDLGALISARALRDAYNGFCTQNSLRQISQEAFGRACTDMFGPRSRLPAVQTDPTGNSQSKRRPWGYDVPDGDKWQEKVDARLGIKK